MLGASNIRQILRDTLAAAVWHAAFSFLRNTFNGRKDMPAWMAGFFFAGRTFRFSDMRAACLFGKHAPPVGGMPVANGPGPAAFPLLLACFSPARSLHLLPEHGKCEGANV